MAEKFSLWTKQEKKCVFEFSPQQSFTVSALALKFLFFSSKLFKFCGSNWKEGHLFLDRLMWLVEILQICYITEVGLGQESLPNRNQSGTIKCFETISLLFPLLLFFFQRCFYELMVHAWFFYPISTGCKWQFRWQGLRNSTL